MVEASHIVPMMTSLVMMDHTKTAIEKAVCSLLIVLIAYVMTHSVDVKNTMTRVFRKMFPNDIQKGLIVRECRMLVEEYTGYTSSIYSGTFLAYMYDIENRVNRKEGVWGRLLIEQKYVSGYSLGKIQLPETADFLPVGDDYPGLSISLSYQPIRSVNNQSENYNKSYVLYVVKTKAACSELIERYANSCKATYNLVTSGALVRSHVFTHERKKDDNGYFWNMMPFTSTKSFDNMFFDSKDVLKRVLDGFANGREEYKRLGMPYTLSLMLHGEPGTGKTSVIKSIVNYTQRHLVVVPTKNIQSIEDLKSVFHEPYLHGFHVPNDKRLYVFEEIDCGSWQNMVIDRRIKMQREAEQRREKKEMMRMFISGRANNGEEDEEFDDGNTETGDKHQSEKAQGPCTPLTKKKGSNKTSGDEASSSRINGEKNDTSESDFSSFGKCKITLGEFLDILDGIIEMEGRMIIFTTNRIGHLDSALLRPGRADHVLEIRRLTREDVCHMYHHWFSKQLPEEVRAALLPDRTFTQAELGKLFLTRDFEHVHASLCGKPTRDRQ